MTDGYIIAISMPIVKPLYRLSFVTYLSKREQLSIFAVMLQNSQLILDSWIETENWLDYVAWYRLEPYEKTKNMSLGVSYPVPEIMKRYGWLRYAPRGIRTHDPRFRSLSIGLFSTDFEAKLLFCVYSYFSLKNLF